VLDVILHDPVAISKQYVRDLFVLPAKLSELIAYPLNMLVFPGLFLLVARARPIFLAFLLIVTPTQILLLNLKTFEVRYYLFLAPLFSVALVALATYIVEYSRRDFRRFGMAITFVGLLTLSFLIVVRESYRNIHAQDAELSEFRTSFDKLELADPMIAGRKLQLAKHVGAKFLQLRGGSSLNDLKKALAAGSADEYGQLFVYFGPGEAAHWPQFGALSDPKTAPQWLTPVAQGKSAGGWILYRVEL
ncbi:MAG: hypothetical protein AAFV59_16445, partial [Pseudomonadota bacterium]